MRKLNFLFIITQLLCKALTVKAQRGDYYLTTDGVPMHETSYSEIEGYPYVFDKWLPGKATTDKGRVFAQDIKLKYNVYDDQLMFIYGDADQPLAFADPIKSFEIFTPQPLTFVNGFPAIDKQTPKTYYQAIALGRVSILKKYIKAIIETKGFNTGTVTRRFNDDVAYYIYVDNKMAPFKKNKDAVLSATADKSTQIADFIKTNNINFKKDDDLARLFNYYNTL